MSKYTKEEIASIVVKCAEKYKIELEQKTLLFVCVAKDKKISTFECSFYGNNFLHLTGLKSVELSSNDFFRKCLNHNLSQNDFTFDLKGFAFLKLELLPKIICKNLHASMIGDYDSQKPLLCTEKIVGNISDCMGFVYDAKLEKFIPNTILKYDMRDLISNSVRIIATYRKSSDDKLYRELTYKAKKVDWSTVKFPEEFSYLQISDDADGVES